MRLLQPFMQYCFSKIASLFTRRSYVFSDFFIQKLHQSETYYLSTPGMSDNGCFSELPDYLTFEDIELLIYGYCQKHRFSPGYDLQHVKAIEDIHQFNHLQNYLQSLGPLAPQKSIKLILKIKKGEPAHYPDYQGMHMLAVYIRNEGNRISAFIFDSASGLMCDKRDGFDNLTSTIETYLKQQNPTHYRIIKSSAIVQSDFRNCPIYSLSALRYFIKQGNSFFGSITPHLIPLDEKITDLNNDKIFHLKADGLPASLVKMSNRQTFTRVVQAYRHEWMPMKLNLTPAYASHDDLIAHLGSEAVGKHPQKTLTAYLHLHGERKTNSKGEPYFQNLAANRKMRKARLAIHNLMNMHDVFHGATSETLTLERNNLDALFQKVRR